MDVLLVCTTKSVTCFATDCCTTDFFRKVVQQQYVSEVGKSITVMSQINSV